MLKEVTGDMGVTRAETPCTDTPILSHSARIKDKLRMQHLNMKERKSLINICEEFNNVFHLEEKALTCTTLMQHEITTKVDKSTLYTDSQKNIKKKSTNEKC